MHPRNYLPNQSTCKAEFWERAVGVDALGLNKFLYFFPDYFFNKTR